MHSGNEWWSTFFSGLAAESLSRLYPEEYTRAEARFLLEAFGPARPLRVLDVPCGTGRLALELAAGGIDVTGVDLTGAFIEEARAGAARRGLPAAFERRDMRDLPPSWEGSFDGACCFGNSFGYLSDEGNIAFLAAVGRSLRPGGKFVLDVPLVAETLRDNLVANSWHRIGDILMLWSAGYRPEEGRAVTEYTFIRGERIERKEASYRIYTYRQLLELLGEAGFGRIEGKGSLSGEPFAWGSRALHIIAVR